METILPIHYFVNNINQGPADINSLLTKLNKFRIFWEFLYLKKEEDIEPTYTDIKNSFIIMRYQIISFSTHTNLPCKWSITKIGIKIQKLGSCDDYDGWNPNIFQEYGNDVKN